MSINKCLGCNKAIIQTEGKRQCKWCSESCRKATARRSIPDKSNTGHKPDTASKAIPDNLKQCQYCGTDLPTLSSQHPRKTKHTMTVMERLFYRPANELKPGEHNFVSLPGRACYGVYE